MYLSLLLIIEMFSIRLSEAKENRMSLVLIESLSALSTISLFVRLCCVWAFVCFALVCLLISLPLIQLLLLVQWTSVCYFNFYLSFEVYQNLARDKLQCL